MYGRKGLTAYPTESEQAYRSFKLISLTMTDWTKTIAVIKKRKELTMGLLQDIMGQAEVRMQNIANIK